MLKNSVEYKRFVRELSSIIDCSLNDKSDECIDGMQGYKYSGKDIIGITLELRMGKCKNLADLRKMKIRDKHIMPFIHSAWSLL